MGTGRRGCHGAVNYQWCVVADVARTTAQRQGQGSGGSRHVLKNGTAHAPESNMMVVISRKPTKARHAASDFIGTEHQLMIRDSCRSSLAVGRIARARQRELRSEAAVSRRLDDHRPGTTMLRRASSASTHQRRGVAQGLSSILAVREHATASVRSWSKKACLGSGSSVPSTARNCRPGGPRRRAWSWLSAKIVRHPVCARRW